MRLLRLLRLLRLFKLDKFIAAIEDRFEISLNVFRILGMVLRLMFMVHTLGCFWWYVGMASAASGSEETWITRYNGGSAIDGPVHEQYTFSVYWALTTVTTIGYGDITPVTMLERYYTVFAMLIATMMFGYMMSTIGSMMMQMDRESALKQDRMDAVKEWMTSRNMPRKLFVRVRTYYEYYYSKKSLFDEEQILAGLTPALQQEVTTILLRDSLGHLPLFALLGVEFQRWVYPRLKPLTYVNLDVIYKRGDISKDIYFLRKGTVDVLAAGLDTKTLYRLNQGQYFGEEALTHQRRGCSVLSNGWTEIWSLSSDVLDETMAKFPDLTSKLDTFVVGELDRKARLYTLAYRILISVSHDPEKRAALIMQKFWVAYAANKARRDSQFAATSGTVQRLKQRTAQAGIGSFRNKEAESLFDRHTAQQREASRANSHRVGGSDGAVAEALKDIQLQLNNLKSSQTAIMTKLATTDSNRSSKNPKSPKHYEV